MTKAKSLDMLSTYDVAKHIHNNFSAWLKELKSNIGVSDPTNLCSHTTHLTGSMHLAKSCQLQMDGILMIQKGHFLG